MDYEFSRLLLSPVCMGPSKLVEFWVAAHNLIKFDRKGEPPPEIIQFRDNDLNISPTQFKLFGDEEHFHKVLPEEHWEALKIGETGVERWNTTQVTRLLQLMRNKHPHARNCGLQLGWFQNGIVRDQADDYPFVKTWITWFPRLTPFLFHQFQKHRASLGDLYPEWLYPEQNSEVNWFVTAEDFVDQLHEACTTQLNSGFVEERFELTIGDATKIVELRTLPGRLLTKLLNNNNVLDIVVSKDKVTFGRDGQPLEYNVNNVEYNKCCTYIFVHTSAEIHFQAILSVITKSRSRILVFSHSDVVPSIASEFLSIAGFRDKPVCFHDLPKSKQETVLSGKVEMQGKEFYLWDFLPQQEEILHEFLPQIKGNELNSLLRNQKLSVLPSCKLPNVDQHYVERHLRCRDIISPEFFKSPCENEIFVIIMKPNEEIKDSTILELAEENVFPRLKVSSNSGVFCVKIDNNKFMKALTTCEGSPNEHVNVHFLKKLGKDKFERIATRNLLDFLKRRLKFSKDKKNIVHLFQIMENDKFRRLIFTNGLLASLGKPLSENPKISGVMTEREFIESIEKRDKRLFLVAGQPGMGKSALVNHMANICGNIGAFAIKLFMSKFMNNLTKTNDGWIREKVSCDDIISNIISLACSKSFDEDFLKMLLKSHKPVLKMPKVYLFFDGIDEVVKPEFIKLAVDTLKLLNSEFPSLPIIASVREHVFEEIESYFEIFGHRLEPLKTWELMQLQQAIWCDSIKTRIAEQVQEDGQFDVKLNRKLYPLNLVHSSILTSPASSPSDFDKFVLIASPLDQIEISELEKYTIVKCNTIDILLNLLFGSVRCNKRPYVGGYVYLIEVKDKQVREVCNIIDEIRFSHCYRNPIHILRYVGKDTYERIEIVGNPSKKIENAYIESSMKLSPVKEDDFLGKLDSTERVVVLWEDPITTMSLLLVNWSIQLKQSSKVLFLSMSDLIDQLSPAFWEEKDSLLIEKQVMEAIFKSAHSSGSLAELSNKKSSRLEIFIDGLDCSNGYAHADNDKRLLDFLQKINKVLSEFPKFRVWVSLRGVTTSNLFTSVKKTLGAPGYRVQPLTEKEETEYAEMFWREQMNDGKNGNEFPIPKIFEIFSKKCIKQFFEDDLENSGVPLQVQMTAEILENEVYHFTLCSTTNSKSTLYHLCKQIVDRKYGIFLYEKNQISHGFARESYLVKGTRLLIDNYLKHYAIQEIFSEKVAEQFSYELCIPDCAEEREKDLDQLLKHGIIRNRFWPMFAHRTLAEYYVAKFVVDYLRRFYPLGKNKLEWFENDKSDIASFIRDTIFSVKEHMKVLENPNICIFINAFLEDKFVAFANDKSKNIQHNNYAGLYDIPCPFRRLTNRIHTSLARMKAIHRLKLPSLESFLIYSPNNFLVVLLNSLLSVNYDYIEYLMEKFGHNRETLASLQELDVNGYGWLHWFIYGLHRNVFVSDDCLIIESRFRKTLKKLVFVDDGRARFALEEKNFRGETSLLLLNYCQQRFYQWPIDLSLHRFFVNDLGANVNATDNSGNSVLHFKYYEIDPFDEIREPQWTFYDNYLATVRFFLEESSLQPDLINSKNGFGFTPIQSFLHFTQYASKPKGRDKWQENFCRIVRLINVFHEHGADFNIPDQHGNSAFINLVKIICVYGSPEEKIIKDSMASLLEHFVSRGANPDTVNKNGMCGLHYAVMKNIYHLAHFLATTHPLLLKVIDADGKTIIQYANCKKMHRFIKRLESWYNTASK